MKDKLNGISSQILTFLFQELPQEDDEAGVTEKEHWDRTIRIVLTKFTKLNDFLRQKFDLGGQKANKVPDQNELAQQKFREEQETFQLYQILLARDKELHQLVLDIHEMKAMILTYFGEGHSIPPRPMYKALPYTNIRQPHPPHPVPQIQLNNAGVRQQQSQNNDNSLFRNIMNKKAPREFSTANKLPVGGDPLSASWEDLSSYGDQGTDATELS